MVHAWHHYVGRMRSRCYVQCMCHTKDACAAPYVVPSLMRRLAVYQWCRSSSAWTAVEGAAVNGGSSSCGCKGAMEVACAAPPPGESGASPPQGAFLSSPSNMALGVDCPLPPPLCGVGFSMDAEVPTTTTIKRLSEATHRPMEAVEQRCGWYTNSIPILPIQAQHK